MRKILCIAVAASWLLSANSFAAREPSAGDVEYGNNTGEYTNPYMPAPQADEKFSLAKERSQQLSLKEAILLALRMNPEIQNSELQRIMDKFQIVVAHNEFEPQFKVGFGSTLQNGQPATYGATGGASIKSTFGTQLGVDYGQGFNGAPGSTTVTLSQPLLRGFGAVNKYGYLNALDGEEANKLGFRLSVMQVISSVITSYRTLVEGYNNLKLQDRAIEAAQQQVKQAELRFQAGLLARSELTQVRSNLEQTQLSAEQQKNSQQQNYQNFLQALGLIPTANLIIDSDLDIDLTVQELPPLERCVRLALANNIEYKQAQIRMNSLERAVKQAKNGRLPELDFTISGSMGQGGAGNTATGTSGPFSPVIGGANNQINPIYGAKLSIPLNDVKSQQAMIDARVGLEKAKISLKQQRDNLIRQVMTQWQMMNSQKMQIRVSERAITLQQQSLKDAQLKLRYGRTNAFELTQLQTQLLQAQLNLVGTKIAYLNNITALQQLMGLTLDAWNINLRY